MEKIAKRIVQKWVAKEYIPAQTAELCEYNLLRKMTTITTFCIVLLPGVAVGRWFDAFLIAFGIYYLRAYTNGYHAHSYAGCLLLSIIVMNVSLIITKHTSVYISIIMFFGSSFLIIRKAPTNNLHIHLTKSEIIAMRTRIRMRLTILTGCFLGLLLLNHEKAACVAMSIAAVAISLLFAPYGIN